MMSELGSFNLPELAAWSDLQLGVVSAESPLKSVVIPGLPLEIITTNIQALSMPTLLIAKDRVKLSSQLTHTILSAQAREAAVLAELSASFCYVLLTLGLSGKAALLHDHYLDLEEKIKNYKSFLQRHFGPEPTLTLVAGLRGRQTELPEELKYIDQVLTGTTSVYRLLIEDDDKTLKLYPVGQANGAGQGPSGLIYIPAELSRTLRPTVLAAAPHLAGSDEARQQLFDAFTWQEF